MDIQGEAVAVGDIGGARYVAVVIRSKHYAFGTIIPSPHGNSAGAFIVPGHGSTDKVRREVLAEFEFGGGEHMTACNGGLCGRMQEKIRRGADTRESVISALRATSREKDNPRIVSAYGSKDDLCYLGVYDTADEQPDIYPIRPQKDNTIILTQDTDRRVWGIRVSGVPPSQLAECLYRETVGPTHEEGVGAAACILGYDDSLSVNIFNAKTRDTKYIDLQPGRRPAPNAPVCQVPLR